jgi:hypothetical protein
MLVLEQIIGQRPISASEAETNRRHNKRNRRQRDGIDGILPMSKSTWFAGIKTGRFPAPDVRDIGRNYWKESTIDALLERMAASDQERKRTPPPPPSRKEAA